MNWTADKKTISWNQMYDTVAEIIDAANNQMQQQQQQIVIGIIMDLITKHNILLSDINEMAKKRQLE